MHPYIKLVGAGIGGLAVITVIGTTATAIRGTQPQPSETPTMAAAAPTAQPTAQPTIAPATATPAVSPVAAAAAPPPATPGVERVRVTGVGAEGLNMRGEPSTSGRVVKRINDGAELIVIGPSREADGRAWRNVRDPADGAAGWVAAEFMGPMTAEAAPQAPAASTQTAIPKPAAPAPAAAATPPSKPAPGSAIVCNDGSTWPNMTRQGACSRRGGIAPGY